MDNHIGSILISLLIGLLLGLLIMWLLLRKNRQQKDVQAQFDQYRRQVDQQFLDMSDLMDKLDYAYKQIRHQWTHATQQLLQPDALQHLISHHHATQDSMAATEVDEQTEDAATPPYTDATQAEVVPINGQPDQVPDRIGPNAVPADKPEHQAAVLADHHHHSAKK